MEFLTAQKVFEFYYDEIIHKGRDRGDNLCLFDVLIKITFPRINTILTPERKWSMKYAEREYLWYLSGDRSVSEIKKFAPIWDKMHKGDDLVWSNYGYWWKEGDQLNRIVQMLKDDPITRKAVIVHYSADLSPEFTKDTPCNLVLNFYVHADQLNLTVMARSIDLWYGFCNDQYIFSKLMIYVAEKINLPVGTMSYFITNFHIYKNQIK